MSFFRTWMCGYCLKQESISITAEEAKEKDGYKMKLPEGWVWHKYKSARMQHMDTRMLGCCPEHARLAAKKFEMPEGM